MSIDARFAAVPLLPEADLADPLDAAPLARALIRAREGDQVRFQSPAGWREVEVISVEYVTIEP